MLVKRAISILDEIEKILENSFFERINKTIEELKTLLRFSGKNITHYTSISTAQFLILNKSPLQISEGSFLNDTSEGKELFEYLEYDSNSYSNPKEFNFSKRPFIGSFVDENKNNDLTLWRMYGKEKLEEAKGCSITLNSAKLKIELLEKINPNNENNIAKMDDIEFYRVVYRNGDSFDFADSSQRSKNELKKLMHELKQTLKEYHAEGDENKSIREELNILELLNEVAYLFKSYEYQYENEIRLVITEAIGFDKKININKEKFEPSQTPPKVYIDLVPINSLIQSICIGPKVDKGEEWASTFYYALSNDNYKPEISVSTLPFK